mgnify:CR=1 FL=1
MLLPLPENLTDSMTLNVGGNELGAMGAVMTDVATMNGSSSSSIVNSFAEATSKFYDSASYMGQDIAAGKWDSVISEFTAGLKNSARIPAYMSRDLIGSIAPGAGFAMDVATQSVINPHIALSFKGAELKNHSFSWNFSPKDEEESFTLKKVLDLLKIESHPRKKSIIAGVNNSNSLALSRGLLKYPSLVDIYFVGVAPAYFYYFKPCMISSISINYTPQGLAINKGGAPAMVNLQVNLQESTINTADDFESSSSEFTG